MKLESLENSKFRKFEALKMNELNHIMGGEIRDTRYYSKDECGNLTLAGCDTADYDCDGNMSKFKKEQC